MSPTNMLEIEYILIFSIKNNIYFVLLTKKVMSHFLTNKVLVFNKSLLNSLLNKG